VPRGLRRALHERSHWVDDSIAKVRGGFLTIYSRLRLKGTPPRPDARLFTVERAARTRVGGDPLRDGGGAVSGARVREARRHRAPGRPGRVPNLAEFVAGAPIRGSWWGTRRGRRSSRAANQSWTAARCSSAGWSAGR
jgi:hypothetical protein